MLIMRKFVAWVRHNHQKRGFKYDKLAKGRDAKPVV